ncbi:hypothetical protein SLEP1_g25077 [Rubroshorea leprosula]|uniref:Dynein light chain n=1 Tax=Rubroshorea leprosula TaxID=152421 RepID=A0AAV5JN34_9ROSI|nr:hypothetical protein SLEP1_g25077 [Rubroshorea leprosula]
MDPNFKRHPKHTTTSSSSSCSSSSATKPSRPTTKAPDPTLPSSKSLFMSGHFSRLNPNHKTRKPQNHTNQHNHPPPSKDIYLQAKAMTVSADAVSSVFSLINPKNPRYKTEKEALKESLRKSDADWDRKKSQQELATSKKKAQKDGVFDAKKVDLAVKSKQVEGQQEGHDVKRNSVALRRRSVGGLQVELADVIANCGVKIVSVDMPPYMQIHAVDCARKTHDSLEKFTSKTLALTLKKEFDGVYGPAWHCIVGTSFGSFVTHSVGGFLYFSMDHKLYILLFKTTVQRAE